MILVDTSIWIAFFRGVGGASSQLKKLILHKNRAAITGIVLQEVLQGLRDDASYESTRHRLSFLPYLDADKEVFHLAASLYRTLRKQGLTVPSTDALIAAVALHHDVPLYTDDNHFALIAKFSKLQILQFPGKATP